MLGTDDIWAELKRRRITATNVAQSLGVSTSTVTRTINGDIRTPNQEIIAVVAGLLGVCPELLKPGHQHVEKINNKLLSSATSNQNANRTKTVLFADKSGQNSSRSASDCQSKPTKLTKISGGRTA